MPAAYYQVPSIMFHVAVASWPRQVHVKSDWHQCFAEMVFWVFEKQLQLSKAHATREGRYRRLGNAMAPTRANHATLKHATQYCLEERSGVLPKANFSENINSSTFLPCLFPATSYTAEFSMVSDFLPIAFDSSIWRFEEDYPGKAGWIGTDEVLLETQTTHPAASSEHLSAAGISLKAPKGVISFAINVSHHAEIAVGYLATFDNTGTIDMWITGFEDCKFTMSSTSAGLRTSEMRYQNPWDPAVYDGDHSGRQTKKKTKVPALQAGLHVINFRLHGREEKHQGLNRFKIMELEGC
jgi:hypothetical protein